MYIYIYVYVYVYVYVRELTGGMRWLTERWTWGGVVAGCSPHRQGGHRDARTLPMGQMMMNTPKFLLYIYIYTSIYTHI